MQSLQEQVDDLEREINTLWKAVIILMIVCLAVALMLGTTLIVVKTQNQYLQGEVGSLRLRFDAAGLEQSIVVKRGHTDNGMPKLENPKTP